MHKKRLSYPLFAALMVIALLAAACAPAATPAPATALPPSGTGASAAQVDDSRRIELWHALAAALLLLLLAEGLLVQR